jgi:hypothetical protein
MTRVPRTTVAAAAAAALLVGLVAAPPSSAADRRPELRARAVLPADTFAPGPVSGTALGAGPFNGRTPPFAGQPVQGFSALIEDGRRGRYLALSDNGYGAKANSADFLLRAHRLRVDFRTGTVHVRGSLGFSDPRGLAGQPLTRADRQLTGADFDPESIRRVADGTYWVGEEFGPSLLHFSASGELLSPPVRLPVPQRLSAYGRGRALVTSPDAPELAVAAPPATDGGVRPPLVPGPTATRSANLPGSRGIEGMALSVDGRTLYPSLEGSLVDDPEQRRRVVYAFDVATERFRRATGDLRLGAAGDAIGDLTAAGPDTLLVIARDNAQGAAARTKDVIAVDVSRLRGALPTTPVADLLSLSNPALVGGPAQPGTVGLGDPFAFPFQTIESVLVQNRRTLVIANDNNFPFSSGRRPGAPDDNEIIRIRLPRPLTTGSRR